MTFGGRLATLLVFAWCVFNLVAGLLLIVWRPAGERLAYAGGVFVPLFDPVPEGIFDVLAAGVVGWCQYLAAFRRSAAASYLVGGQFFVLGVMTCLGPWDPPRDALAVGYLLVGVLMWRWARRLRKARWAARAGAAA
jgi:hypothetical protein